MSLKNFIRDKSWTNMLLDKIEEDQLEQISDFINQERSMGKEVLPPNDLIFEALNTTRFEDVKVVILGQDPYHGKGQAHGLSFSVQPEQKVPPSLRNIYKELHSDIGMVIPEHGHLISWAKQGVLLLNAVLTVNLGEAASHKNAGWEGFTDKVIRLLSEQREGIVFLLWGKFAQGKKGLIDEHRHLVLETTHPSPFAARKGFFGCKHFSRTNSYLIKQEKTPINWEI